MPSGPKPSPAAEVSIHVDTVPHAVFGAVATVSLTGQRHSSSEDFIAIETTEDRTVFAVFDGHGGGGVSGMARTLLPPLALEKLRASGDTAKDALGESFLETDAAIHRTQQFSEGGVGSTATLVFVPHQGDQLLVGSLGDSPALLVSLLPHGGLRHERLSVSHNPSSDKEQRRINAAIDEAISASNDFSEKQRLNSMRPRPVGGIVRVGGTLAVSRALGDFAYKWDVTSTRNAVTAKPTVKTVPMPTSSHERAAFLVLCSDGVTDELDDALVADAVISETQGVRSGQISLEQGLRAAAHRIVRDAVDTAARKPNRERDDITLIIVPLLYG
ncbi:MAG: hypothetical protein MHM6MM_002871 [Cercozoa sp. M6MM]